MAQFSKMFTDFCDQVICIMSTNSMHSIMILAQAVLKRFSRYFVDKIALLHKMPKSKKGHNSVNIYRKLPKVNLVIYTLDTTCIQIS